MNNSAWQNNTQLHHSLEAAFNAVLTQRLQDSPIVNRRLTVQAVGFRIYLAHWTGVLITPWFMSLMLLPVVKNAWDGKQPGEKLNVRFPPGTFEFTIGREHNLDLYAACSLFSPMFQFERQDAAIISAEAALQELFADSAAQHAISRRELLLGAFGKEKMQP